MFNFHKKEAPLLGLQGSGGGLGYLAGGGAAVTATGGEITQHVGSDGKVYNLHLWTSATAAPLMNFVAGAGGYNADVLVVGAGGGGGG